MQELKKCKKVLVEVNQTCNLNCTYCFYRDYGRVTNRINLQNIDDLLENCPLADEFYQNGDYVIFPTDGHTHDKFSPEYKLFPPHNIIGTSGQELYGKIKTCRNK